MPASGLSGYVVSPATRMARRRDVLALGRYLPEHGEARFSKYYERSPLGPPLTVLLFPRLGGEPVGMAALFPVRLRIAGRTVLAGFAGDFAVAPEHRALGAALELQRRLLSAADDAGFGFVLSVPNASAEPVLRRVGYRALAARTRYVKLLRSEAALAEHLPSTLSRSLACVADPLLGMLDSLGRPRRASGLGLRIELPSGFDSRFERAWSDSEGRSVVTPERSASLLDWKFEQPARSGEGRFEIFALAGRDSIAGYVVLERRSRALHVVDLAWAGQDEIVEALLVELTRCLRARGEQVLVLSHFACPAQLTSALRRCGFVRRGDQSTLMVYLAEGRESADALSSVEGWSFLEGDADV